MKKENEILWKWNGVDTPLNKMSNGQLTIVKNYVKNSNKPILFGNSKKVLLTTISEIETSRDNYNTREAIKQIVFNRKQKINAIINKATDKFVSSIYKLQISG